MGEDESLLKRDTALIGTDPVVVSTDASPDTTVSVQVFHTPPPDGCSVATEVISESQPAGTIVMNRPDPYLAVQFMREGPGRAPIPIEYEIRGQSAAEERGLSNGVD
jgi:hypothetical protein